MRSFLSVASSSRVSVFVNRAIELYQAACLSSQQPLEDCWKALGGSASVSTLASLVKEDLQRRFDRGERPKVAEYLDKFPILTESNDRVVSLVYEEFCLLQEHGENPDSHEFCDAYGPWRDSLLSQLAYHRQLSLAVGSETPSVKFPSPGDCFDKYRLRSILGTGGVARVYLATEDDLGGRKLAIKVSASFGQEPAILAKLDHHNIVPILTVASSESGLRGICMPYRPGITLEQLIRRIGRGKPPRPARAIWDALEPVDAQDLRETLHFRAGWEGFPIRRTYADAVAWIGLSLANALSYLHGQGVFHRDIKPANVLLAYREGPQLLDFNLAQDPDAPENVNNALKGGTLPYMAPEQLKAFLDPAGWTKVGAAADLYSLGLVLKELLTGQVPDLPTTRGSLPREIQNLIDRRSAPRNSLAVDHPAIPPSLVSIIEKCLCFHPSDRYASAEYLAEDLQFFLDRKPLRHSPNRSKLERFVNWNHRNRHLSLTIFSVLVFSTLGFQVSAPSRVPDRADFRRAERLLDSGRPEDLNEARTSFDALHRMFPGSAWPTLHLALTLEKLGGDDAKRASDLMEEARKEEDAEEALTTRLRKNPRSATLLLNLGLFQYKERKDSGMARTFLQDAIKLDPGRCMSLVALAEVERTLNHPEESFRLLEKAIAIGESSKLETLVVYQLRTAIIPLAKKLAENIIDRVHSVSDREVASNFLDKLDEALQAQRRDWSSMNQATSGLETHVYTEHFFTGCLASCRAALAAERSDQEAAARLFAEAKSSFDHAFAAITPSMPNALTLYKQLEDERVKLDQRLDRFPELQNITAAQNVRLDEP